MMASRGPIRRFAMASIALFIFAAAYPTVQIGFMDKTVDVAPISKNLLQSEKNELQKFADVLEDVDMIEREDIYEMYELDNSTDVMTKEKKHILDEVSKKSTKERKVIASDFKIFAMAFILSLIPAGIETYMLRTW